MSGRTCTSWNPSRNLLSRETILEGGDILKCICSFHEFSSLVWPEAVACQAPSQAHPLVLRE